MLAGGAALEKPRRWVTGTAVLACVTLLLCWCGLRAGSSQLSAVLEPLGSAAKEHTGAMAAGVVVLCALLSTPGLRVPAPEKVPVEKRSDFGQVCVMSFLLCGISGMVNATAIIEMGGCISHMSGNSSHFGRLMGVDAWRFGMLLLAFACGAGIAGFTKADGEAIFQGRYTPMLMSAAVGTCLGALIHELSGAGNGLTEQGNWVTMPLWAFAQGIMNGVTSQFTSLPLRTTHHTGTITDAAAGVGVWVRAKVLGEDSPNMLKSFLLWVCFAGFASGGLAAAKSTETMGIFAVLPPSAALAVLALNPSPCLELGAEGGEREEAVAGGKYMEMGLKTAGCDDAAVGA